MDYIHSRSAENKVNINEGGIERNSAVVADDTS